VLEAALEGEGDGMVVEEILGALGRVPMPPGV
jgi:hypothetical protein